MSEVIFNTRNINGINYENSDGKMISCDNDALVIECNSGIKIEIRGYVTIENGIINAGNIQVYTSEISKPISGKKLFSTSNKSFKMKTFKDVDIIVSNSDSFIKDFYKSLFKAISFGKTGKIYGNSFFHNGTVYNLNYFFCISIFHAFDMNDGKFTFNREVGFIEFKSDHETVKFWKNGVVTIAERSVALYLSDINELKKSFTELLKFYDISCGGLGKINV